MVSMAKFPRFSSDLVFDIGRGLLVLSILVVIVVWLPLLSSGHHAAGAAGPEWQPRIDAMNRAKGSADKTATYNYTTKNPPRPAAP